MKKVKIKMDDEKYANSLSKALNLKYKALSCSITKDIDFIEENVLYITDKKINDLKNYLDLSIDDNRYKSVDYIYSLICEKFEKHFTNTKIIVFANLSQVLGHNPGAFEIAKDLSKKYTTLLVNFNCFHDYGFYKNEIGLESLLFLSENDNMEVNQYEDLYYLNSSYLPIQTNKRDNYTKIINRLKTSNYSYILIDLCFNLSNKNLDILRGADKIIFYNSLNFDNNLLNKTISFLNNDIEITAEKILVQEEIKGFRFISNDNVKNSEKIKDVVELIC